MTRYWSTHLRAAADSPVYPALLGAAWVLNAWRDAVVSPQSLLRPLALAVVGSGMLVLLLGLLFGRRWHVAGLTSALILLLLSNELGFVSDLASRMTPGQAVLWLGAIGAAAVVGISILWQRLRRPGAWAQLTRVMNVFALTLMATILATGVADGSVAFALDELDERPASSDVAGNGRRPDIYIILLDGYPRADTLNRLFGFDNAEFLGDLEVRGFEVADASQSNYMFTQQTLISMLNMRHVDDVLAEADLALDEGRRLRRAVIDNRAFDVVRRHGYRVIATSAGYEAVDLTTADEFIDGGQLNSFERHLIRRTMLIDVLELGAREWLPDQLRERVRWSLDHAGNLAESNADQPRLVFVHVPSPHSPNLFRANGSPLPVGDLHRFQADSPQGVGISEEEFIGQVAGQVAYLNRLTTETIDRILEVSAQPPVVLLLSDHGTRVRVTFGDPGDPDVTERFGTLFASYTPERSGLFGDRITLVNVMPILFNSYLGTDLPCQPDHIFANGPGGYLDLHEVPELEGASNPACGHQQSGWPPASDR
jgi:hypothetical protein